jgi:hypothetical protein
LQQEATTQSAARVECAVDLRDCQRQQQNRSDDQQEDADDHLERPEILENRAACGMDLEQSHFTTVESSATSGSM